MVRGVGQYLVGSLVLGALGALAACSGGSWFVEREPWRHEAEVQCLNAGTVKEGAGVVRIRPISGPGVCGADFPLRVSALAENTALGYGDEFRPPNVIPNASGAAPRWPINPPRAAAPNRSELPPLNEQAYPQRQIAPVQDGPLSLTPQGAVAAPAPVSDGYDYRRPYGVQQAAPPRQRAPQQPYGAAPNYDFSPEPYERRHVIGAPGADPQQEPASEPPRMRAPQQAAPRQAAPQLAAPPLGPSRAMVTGSVAPVAVNPAATLACPMVSALDQWIADAVQPAALRWFGQPVVEIKQISAYSCRGMNGNPRARISEHAFGNALDIAAFILADGRRVTVKDGWHGQPEEQGFLRDAQAGACGRFTTVLAPGSNALHYDHFHVDLMRRNGQACNPRAVSGEEVAARARARYAAKRGGEPSVTGSIALRRLPSPAKRLRNPGDDEPGRDRTLPMAEPGDDGED
jgi:hypothetical protein